MSFPSAGLTLRGTLEIPARDPGERKPAIVLVHGSGPHSRDQPLTGQLNMAFGFELRVFQQLSSRLVGAGYAVLRYDKRSCTPAIQCGDNAYPPAAPSTTVADFIEDVEAAVRFLGSRSELDPERIVVLGHSQGASFVPEVMARRPEVRAGVLVAGHHRPIDALIADQLASTAQLLDETGASPGEVDRALAPLREIVAGLTALRAGTHDDRPIGQASASFWTSWLEVTDRAPAVAAALDRPLLAVIGDYDWNVPASEADLWAATFDGAPEDPGHAVEVVACVTHALNCITQPDFRQIVPGDIGRSVYGPLVQGILTFLEDATR